MELTIVLMDDGMLITWDKNRLCVYANEVEIADGHILCDEGMMYLEGEMVTVKDERTSRSYIVDITPGDKVVRI